MFDITLLTDARYHLPVTKNDYINNILKEDELLYNALTKRGLKVNRTYWDNPDYDWTSTKFAVFRTTWDYFERFQEFSEWLDKTSQLTNFINPPGLIRWNIDKHYLLELKNKDIHIPDTIFIKSGAEPSLSDICKNSNWTEFVLKPAVSGAGRHTYRFKLTEASDYEAVFTELIQKEAMLLQEFQHRVVSEGEIALMLFDGKFSHAVLKKAKSGDFRVQDDFGGSVHNYTASEEEKEFAEKLYQKLGFETVYARVDLIRDNAGKLAVSELELIEPELWLRKDADAADRFADSLLRYIGLNSK